MPTRGPKKFSKTLLSQIRELFDSNYDYIFSLYYDNNSASIRTANETRTEILEEIDSLVEEIGTSRRSVESPRLEELISEFKENSTIQKRVDNSSEDSDTKINKALNILLQTYDYFSDKIFPYQSKDVAKGARLILESAPATEKKNFERLTAYAILARQTLESRELKKSEEQTLKSVFGTTKVEKSPKEIFDGFNETFEEVKKSPVIATYLKTKDIQRPGLHRRHVPSIVIALGVASIIGGLSVLGGLPPSSPSFASVMQFLTQQSLTTALSFAALPALGFTGYKVSQSIATRKLRKLLKSDDLSFEEKQKLFQIADKVAKNEMQMSELQNFLKKYNVKVHQKGSLTKGVLKDTNKGVKSDLSQYKFLKKKKKKITKLMEKSKTADISKREDKIAYLSERYKDCRDSNYLMSIFTPAYAKGEKISGLDPVVPKRDPDENGGPGLMSHDSDNTKLKKHGNGDSGSKPHDSGDSAPITNNSEEPKSSDNKGDIIDGNDKKAIDVVLTSKARKDGTIKLKIEDSTYQVRITKQRANARILSTKKILRDLTEVIDEMQKNEVTESTTLEYNTGIGKNKSSVKVEVTPTRKK